MPIIGGTAAESAAEERVRLIERGCFGVLEECGTNESHRLRLSAP